ncbi:hypothetical protein P7H15_13170 [Paenibacillus larvae]|nr:hypothetical protein [Paenibacillus larvae]MDT2293602.1 hypothetical protein [Paenibacillus larvae]
MLMQRGREDRHGEGEAGAWQKPAGLHGTGVCGGDGEAAADEERKVDRKALPVPEKQGEGSASVTKRRSAVLRRSSPGCGGGIGYRPCRSKR